VQAISPGEVITEFRPRFEQKKDPKNAIESSYKDFEFEVSDFVRPLYIVIFFIFISHINDMHAYIYDYIYQSR